MVGLQLVGRVKSVAADQIAARLGNVDLQGLNKHTNDPLRVASKKDHDLRKQYIRRVSSAGSRWIFLLGKQVEIGHRPWGYESQPAQISKSNNSKRLQPQRFCRVFIRIYMESFPVLMLLSKFPSQYRHKCSCGVWKHLGISKWLDRLHVASQVMREPRDFGYTKGRIELEIMLPANGALSAQASMIRR